MTEAEEKQAEVATQRALATHPISDEDERLRDEVVKRMLATPPQPRKPKGKPKT